jgi:hypothetical protein
MLFLSALIYSVLLWLKKDTQRNLVMLFYLVFTGITVIHYLDLQIVKFSLLSGLPIICVLFILFHQETLQKQFITINKKNSEPEETDTWIDEIVKSCLIALNKQREMILIIERADLLRNLINTPYFIYAELKKDIFEILLDKHSAAHDHMIWINQQGKLVAINATWRSIIDEAWITKEIEHLSPWKQQALYITSKTDAFICKINPVSRNFDLVVQGKLVEGITAEQFAIFLQKNLSSKRKVSLENNPIHKSPLLEKRP